MQWHLKLAVVRARIKSTHVDPSNWSCNAVARHLFIGENFQGVDQFLAVTLVEAENFSSV